MNIIQQIKQIASRSASLIKPDSDTVVFDGGDFEITKRELIASIVIIVLCLF